MRTISLNIVKTYEKNPTSKYWRKVECNPQTVRLETWANDKPFFVLEGTIINSHDSNEIGRTEYVYVQTYNFLLNDSIQEGVYTIHENEL